MIRLFETENLPFHRSEALRYAGIRDPMSSERLDSLAPEAFRHVHARVCYDLYPVHSDGQGTLDLGFSACTSRSLCQLLQGSDQCILFAATIGIDYDRYAARMSSLSQTDGWLLHALGTERIETLCDVFEEFLKADLGFHLTARFSPGYGDIPLSLQRDIFQALDCPRKIGLTLNDSLLMSPSKSVTALLGITQSADSRKNGCSSCGMNTCAFRSLSHETE